MKTMHGALRLGLTEQIAHARRADADEHLDELRSAQAEERHLRFAGDRAREQRLARARRADEQHALRDAAAERRVLARVLQELDDLAQLLRGLVHARDVREAHLHVVVRVDLRAAARERHDAALGAAHPPEEERSRARRSAGTAATQLRSSVSHAALQLARERAPSAPASCSTSFGSSTRTVLNVTSRSSFGSRYLPRIVLVAERDLRRLGPG